MSKLGIELDLFYNDWIKDRERVIEEVNRRLQKYEKRVLREVKDLLDRINNNKEKGLEWALAEKLKLLDSLQRSIKENTVNITNDFKRQMELWSLQSYDNLKKNYTDLINVSFKDINLSALHALSSFGLSGSAITVRSIAGKGLTVDQRFGLLPVAYRKALDLVLTEGIIRGSSFPKLQKLLVQGFKLPENIARRAIRSYGLMSNNMGDWFFMQQNSEILTQWMWCASFDLTTCYICVAKHGTIYPSQSFLSDHFNGHCYMVPIPKGQDPYDIMGDRRSINPYTGVQSDFPASLGYRQWVDYFYKRTDPNDIDPVRYNLLMSNLKELDKRGV